MIHQNTKEIVVVGVTLDVYVCVCVCGLNGNEVIGDVKRILVTLTIPTITIVTVPTRTII